MKQFFSFEIESASIKEHLQFYKAFLKNPVVHIFPIPNWSWAELILSSTAMAALTGFLSGVVSKSILNAIVGIFISPIAGIAVLFVISLLINYYFLFFDSEEISFKKIFTVVYLASIPSQFLFILATFVPIIHIVAILGSCALLIIGFSKNFPIKKSKLTKVVGVLFLVYCLIFIVGHIKTTEKIKKRTKMISTPQSLEILEKEIKNQK